MHGNISYAGELLCSSDDGILLVRNHSTPSYMMLWNPSSKQQERIPRPDEFKFELYLTTFGFCRGPTFDDYKIIAICEKHYAVFSCKDKVWSVRKEFPYGSRNILVKRGVFVDGFSFFVMFEEIRGHIPEIVYFDPRGETFNELQKPTEVLEDSQHFFLTSLRGCLGLCNFTSRKGRLEIWIMRDHNISTVDSNSWTKYMILENYSIAPWIFSLATLSDCGLKNELGIYNSQEKKYEKLDIPEHMAFSRKTIPYVDSLFFPISDESLQAQEQDKGPSAISL